MFRRASIVEVREMRNAETILTVIAERGCKGLPLERVYRLLFNRDLYLRAYGRIYRNDGALTKGATAETVDGMSLRKIDAIIEALRQERYRWTPVRRTQIPKANGKTRPLGIPTWSDKLLQEVVRSILDAYYEPQFSQHSHGFRPDRGCHTALAEVQHNWSGTKWFIEGDIKGCFDNINHRVLIATLQEKIRDGRFISLIAGMLQAGYLEDWVYHKTLSGTPQGGVISPILANIYLSKLDEYVVGTLIPEFTKGDRRRTSNAYLAVYKRWKRAKASGKVERAKELRELLLKQPINDYQDPNYRRLRYVRYADDFVLGFIGRKEEADQIKDRLAAWLRDNLSLTMSEEKTLITHAVTGAARFLGYEITAYRSDQRPSINGRISLRIPKDKLRAACDRYRKFGKPTHRTELIDNSDFSIVGQYGLEYRGFVQYYQMATNIHWMRRLHWSMWVSLLKTLARKHKSSVLQMSNQFRPSSGAKGVVEVLIQREGKQPLRAIFGDVLLRRNRTAGAIFDIDPKYRIINSNRTELEQRVLADHCESCGSTEDVEVHHVRRLSDLSGKGKVVPNWKRRMAALRRKTFVVCRVCHDRIHAGLPTLEPQP